MRRVHGMTSRAGGGTPEYEAWRGMVDRCENTRRPYYKNYGGRGIRIWEGWRHDPAAFAAYIGPRPSPAHTLDRIDVNGHYEPGNVRWATRSEQMRNTRSNRMITIGGETRCLAAWLEHYGVSARRFHRRLAMGWDEARALTTPLRRWPSQTTERYLGRYRDDAALQAATSPALAVFEQPPAGVLPLRKGPR